MRSYRRPFSPVFRLLLIAAGPAVAAIPRSAAAPTPPVGSHLTGVGLPSLLPANLSPLPEQLPPLQADPRPVFAGEGLDRNPVANLPPARAVDPLGLDHRDPWDPARDLSHVIVLSARPMIVTSFDATDPWEQPQTAPMTTRYEPRSSVDPRGPWPASL
jgi:hypothetical protein